MMCVVSKWGNSLGVRIPRAMADQMDISEGEFVELTLEDNNIHIHKVYQLKNLLEQVKPDNLHSEIEINEPIGEETW